jgi:uncharacterized protein (DUF2062 family)
MMALITIANIWLGKLILRQPMFVPRTTNWQVLGKYAYQSLGAWLLGSVIIGLAASFAFGLGTLYGVRALRRRKQAAAQPASTAPQAQPQSDPEMQALAQPQGSGA